MINLVCVTWSYEETYEIKQTFLYKSFVKENDELNFHHIHFNRNNYLDLEKKFDSDFGYQYEFLLYRIYLLKDILKDFPHENLLFSDTNDVVCLGDIQILSHSISDKVVFSCESHQYPNENNISNWYPINTYSEDNKKNRMFLNAGISYGNRKSYIDLFEKIMSDVFPLKYKNFGGDQGVFTYLYLNTEKKLLDIDTNKIFLNTYSISDSNFYKKNDKLYENGHNSPFLLVHDNGWNYGSPKFIERFQLI